MGTEEELMRFLKENPPSRKFVPYIYHSKEADALTVYFEGDADYSVRLNDHITLYLSLETNEVVGCRVKGVKGIIEDLPNYMKVSHGGVGLSLIFLAFRGGADEGASEKINDLARVASERQMLVETS